MGTLVTFGEALLRYAPPSGERLESADTFSIQMGGAESNVAVAVSRLGHESIWLSKLAATPLGRRIEQELRGHGVDPEIVWTDDGRQGVYYLEMGAKPRETAVVYDRERSAVRTAVPDELASGHIEAADAFYVSGITPALSETLRDTTAALLRDAREAGTTTVFDVNYRSKLWGTERARECLIELLDLVDILVVAKRDAASVFGYTTDAVSIGRDLRKRYGHDIVVVTRGERGAAALNDQKSYEQPAFETETHDPIGTGDAFVGGFLARWLAAGGIGEALEYGVATAALKRTMYGDIALVTPDEVAAVLKGDDSISR